MESMPQIGPAQPGDEEAIAQVHTASWWKAYAGLVPHPYLAALDWRERAERWRPSVRQPPADRVVLVARSEVGVVGFAAFGPAREGEAPGDFELYAIYVSPEAWRSGVGSALLQSGLDWLSGRAPRLVLWVLRDNLRARGFYEGHGFEADGATKSITLGGAELVEVRYVKRL